MYILPVYFVCYGWLLEGSVTEQFPSSQYSSHVNNFLVITFTYCSQAIQIVNIQFLSRKKGINGLIAIN